MTAKLRLVIDKTKTPKKKSFLDKFFDWLTAPHFFEFPQFGTTGLEKRQYILHHLTIKFAEYQATTGTVGLFPAIEAMNEVDKLEQQGRIDAYYRMLKRKIG